MELRPDMKDAPRSMTSRPVDHRGFYVPWFVTKKDEQDHWDFQGIDSRRFYEAMDKHLCWVSGQPLGKYVSFVVGPMCCINLVAGDPPTRREEAEWSARVCPFLSRPLALRGPIPEDHVTGGNMVPDNPGTVAVWTCLKNTVGFNRKTNLFHLPEPTSVEFWHKSERASKEQVKEAMKIGARKIKAMAEEQDQEMGVLAEGWDPATGVGAAEREAMLYIEHAFTRLEKLGCM